LEQVQHSTGTKLAHVPYKGNAPLLQDLGGGQVDFAVLVYSAAMGALAEQGRMKVIGQLGAQRSELLKQVPKTASPDPLLVEEIQLRARSCRTLTNAPAAGAPSRAGSAG
jgi:hypothetical protein